MGSSPMAALAEPAQDSEPNLSQIRANSSSSEPRVELNDDFAYSKKAAKRIASASSTPPTQVYSSKVSKLVERSPKPLPAAQGLASLSGADRDLAQELEILPLLQELHGTPPPAPDRQQYLRQKITETVMESYFDVVSFHAEASRELSNLEALHEKLIGRRDRGVEINNAGNFIGSGTLNTLGSVLGFSDSFPSFPGNFYQMMSGIVSMGMSGYALKQQSGGPKSKGQGRPTVLAELFGRPTDDRTIYPESVWRFFQE